MSDTNHPADHPTRAGWVVPVAVVTFLVLVAAVVLLWQGLRGGTPGATPSSPSGGSSATTSPGTPSSTSSTPSTTALATIAAPVYYVVDVPDFGPRLYREFHRLPLDPGGPIVTSLTEMFRDNPVDPDYRSMWPTTTRVLSVSTSGDLATVDLSGFVALGAAFESAAVDELVYTVTASQPTIRRVTLLVNGATPPSGHSDWSAPISRAPALDVQSQVWILEPSQGATVTSPVRIHVLGTGFEGTVPLRVYRGGTQVVQVFVTTMMGGFAEAETSLSLPAGTYELRAYNDNARDGGLYLWDTKTFTVS